MWNPVAAPRGLWLTKLPPPASTYQRAVRPQAQAQAQAQRRSAVRSAMRGQEGGGGTRARGDGDGDNSAVGGSRAQTRGAAEAARVRGGCVSGEAAGGIEALLRH